VNPLRSTGGINIGDIICDSYIDGFGNDWCNGISVVTIGSGAMSQVYGAGQSSGPGLPLTAFGSSYLQGFAGVWDGFIFRLNGGNNLEWLTYVGGDSFDFITDIALRPALNAKNPIVVGSSESDDSGDINMVPTDGGFPHYDVAGGYNAADPDGGFGDHFIAEFEGLLLTPNWINKFGGASIELHGNDYESPSVDVRQSNGEVYIAGTYSVDAAFPLTTSLAGGTYNQGVVTTTGPGNENGYIARFNGNNDLTWCSSFGGDGTDNEITDILVTDDGVFICGNSDLSGIATATPCTVPSSGEFPYCNLSGDNYTETNATIDRMFLAKFDFMDNLSWSTAFGDNVGNNLRGMDANSSDLYISGVTGPNNTLWEYDTGSPLDYYRITNSTNDDATIARFDLNFTVGVEDYAQNELNIIVYPNPTNDLATIGWGLANIETVKIYNSIGQLLMTNTVKGETTEVNFSGYTNGLYYIILVDQSGMTYNSELIKH